MQSHESWAGGDVRKLYNWGVWTCFVYLLMSLEELSGDYPGLLSTLAARESTYVSLMSWCEEINLRLSKRSGSFFSFFPKLHILKELPFRSTLEKCTRQVLVLNSDSYCTDPCLFGCSQYFQNVANIRLECELVTFMKWPACPKEQ